MQVAIIDYGSGNLRSAAKAFARAAQDNDIAAEIVVTADPAVVARADRVVLPGVGAFADCKRGLAALPGMIEAMENAARKQGKPFLGICVGMQLLATLGHEHGTREGLGWIAGEVGVLEPADAALKIPHMGWNNLDFREGGHPLLAGLAPGAHAYFVHSYAMKCRDAADVVATADYGGPVTALIARGNIAGTQFHPEKSQATGLRLIANFLRWEP
ncbi:MAG: imidazole glycerol phosphate synthase subunit HisH [Pseudomonadota bacterium]